MKNFIIRGQKAKYKLQIIFLWGHAEFCFCCCNLQHTHTHKHKHSF